MKWNSRLVILISLIMIYVKTESTNTDYDSTVLAGCSSSSSDFNYTKLVDKNIKTYWGANKCTFEGQDNVWYVSFTTSRLVEVAGYKITLAHIISYNPTTVPKSWILKAKEKEDQSWEIIDERTDETIAAVNNGNYTFYVNKPGNYQYFAFVVTSLQGPSSNIILGELWLLSSCPNDDIASNECICGANGNVCNEGQMCYSGDCIFLSACPNDDIAPKIGCICGANGKICKEGQKCYDVVCLYPPPTQVSVIFLIIGLFFALTLILVCFIL